MTTCKLIAALQKLPPETEVLFDLGDEFISVECVEPSDPEGAVLLTAEAAAYKEEEKDGVFQRFIG